MGSGSDLWKWLRRQARAARYLVSDRRLMADGESFRAFRQARHSPEGVAGVDEVVLRPRALAPHTIVVRPGTSDPQVVWYALAQQAYLPPGEIESGIRSILDLGANIGVAAALMAVRFPLARMLLVELDPENAALCQRNVAPWSDRCEVVQAAVWSRAGTVAYELRAGREDAARVVAASDAGRSAPAVTIVELIDRLTPGLPVDFVKMNVEGAEREIVQSGFEWAVRVRAVKIETHHPYSPEECAQDLESLGFRTRIERAHAPWVIGLRAPG